MTTSQTATGDAGLDGMNGTTVTAGKRERSGGVQSLDRAFCLLEIMAEAGGETSLSELAQSSGLPLPTIHRIVRSLVSNGYVRQLPSRRYALGPRLIGLGESASRLLGAWAQIGRASCRERAEVSGNGG